MTRYAACFALLLCAMLCVSGMAHAEPRYRLTVVAGAGSAANGINGTGQVVGSVATGNGRYHAFLHDGMGTVDLGTLGGERSSARGFNDDGTVVGRSDTSDGGSQGFVYANGVMAALPFASASQANSINNQGVIAGTFVVNDPDDSPESSGWRAFRYADGVVTNLGQLPGTQGNNSYANGINDAGVIVGGAEIFGSPNNPSEPFVYSNGVMQDLGNLGGIVSEAWAINDAGQVVGAAGVPDTPTRPNIYGYHAFFYSDGVMQNLGAATDWGNSTAFDLNNLGQAVGNSDIAGGTTRAILYEGGAMLQLDTLIDPGDGWVMTNATGINDQHQIAGTACRLGLCYAVRLDLAPVPEPAHILMLGAGLLLLLHGRKVQRNLHQYCVFIALHGGRTAGIFSLRPVA